jgi:hypothetical protein
MMGLAPTGRRVRTSGIEVLRFERGRMAEDWATFDAVEMVRQIGTITVPGPAQLTRTLVHQARKRLPVARATR